MTADPGMVHDYDIVVIGSGAGGGTVAKELAPLVADGLRIAVLEWGPRLRPEDYSAQELDMTSKVLAEGGMLTENGAMTLAMGKAYGGSTTVYTGTTMAIPSHVVDTWDVPGLSYDDLRPRMAKYEAENNVHLMDESLINENNRLFRDACKSLGYGVDQFAVNIKGCKGASLCNLGCPNGAKQGTDRVQLPRAEAAGVEVVTKAQVLNIGERELDVLVSESPVGEVSGWAPGTHKVRAKAIVLAAGAIHSSALMLKSGYGDRFATLGRYITTHPALILVGQHDRPIVNQYGFPKAYYSEHFMKSHRFLLETCMYFPFVTAKSMAGFGQELGTMMSAMDRLQMILILAMDPAEADNRVVVDDEGRPVVRYEFAESVLDAFVESQRAAARILFASGVGRVHAPSSDRFFIEREHQPLLDQLISRDNQKLGPVAPSAAHMMGGCRMGDGPGQSVTDSWGSVHGIPWLFVADSSLFPQCSEVNPYLTVMGLADRVAERVRGQIAELRN